MSKKREARMMMQGSMVRKKRKESILLDNGDYFSTNLIKSI